MKKLHILVLCLLMIVKVFSNNKICYLEPCDNAKYVNIKSALIIGFENPILFDKKELVNCIDVVGSESKKHEGTITLTEDNKKIIFKPYSEFNYNEKVTVRWLGKKLKNSTSTNYTFEYSFYTPAEKVQSKCNVDLNKEHQEQNSLIPPPLTVTINQNSSPGQIFTTPWSAFSYMVISNNNGSFFWYLESSDLCGDFKMQPNGNFTYFVSGLANKKHVELDRNFQPVNVYYCGNGYTTDIHELRVLNNGHALVMAYDSQYVNMSLIIPGGHPHATVIGLIIQEIDVKKDVVFQWRSWDHFSITDATHENLLDSVIDYVHGNAIELDNDGNLLISSRNLDEITKINRTTGAIIWRMGGINNQFTFINDPIRFSHQHAIRRIANGNVTLFDNGNFHSPPFSRAVEYALNESSKTATLVWQYGNSPNVFGSWGGYVQRLASGNTLIAWGGTTPTITEVTPSGQKVYEASYPPFTTTYRAYKFDLSIPVGTNNQSGSIPKTYSLNQNYPNPFNPNTKITFALPKNGNIELKVYDLLGREISTLVNEFKNAGEHTVEFNASNVSSGIYFYTLKTEGFTDTKKMTVIK
jgi:hypothetical protein